MSKEDDYRWEIQKDRPISDFFVPPIAGEDFIAEEPFLAIKKIANKQFLEHGKRFGALHFKFNNEIASQVKCQPHDFGIFNRTTGYQWQHILKTKKKLPTGAFRAKMTKGKKMDLIRHSLLNSTGTNEPCEAQLTPESTIAQLDDFILECAKNKDPVFIGWEAQVNAVTNFLPMGNLNIFNMKDYLVSLKQKEYGDLSGISLPFAITGKMASLTPLHLEDLEMMSMNTMIIPGIKLWVLIGPDLGDIDLLVNKGKTTLKAKCQRWYQEKSHFFTLKYLVDHKIKFNLIWQTGTDTVITHPHGFHQIVNVADCVNAARNLVSVNTLECVADEALFPCTCNMHDRYACGVKISKQGFHQWIQKYLAKCSKKENGPKTSLKRPTQTETLKIAQKRRLVSGDQLIDCEMCEIMKAQPNHLTGSKHEYMELSKGLIEKGGTLDSIEIPAGSTSCPICPKRFQHESHIKHHQNTPLHHLAFRYMKRHKSSAEK